MCLGRSRRIIRSDGYHLCHNQVHADMAEEDAHDLELQRMGSGLSHSVRQRQPPALETSSDPPPMSSSLRRSGGDPGLPSGMGTIKSHIIDIERDMETELQSQLKKSEVQEKMICKVPEITRSLDKVAYAPQFVSFGPYHRGTQALNSADKYKWLCLEQILNMNKEVTLQKYLEEMDGMKQKVKGCYEEDIQMETNDGIKMLLLDGCCILGFLEILPLPLPLPRQQVEDQIQKQDEVVVEASSQPAIPNSFKERTADSVIITAWHLYDLLLMENQLPFFVLQKIYDLATAGTPVAGSLILKDMVDQTIQKLLASYPLITTEKNFHHLLHCCHLKFRPAKANISSSKSKPTANISSSKSKPTDELQPWRGAMDLYKAGIKFKRKKCNDSESLLDVEFSERTLMIPTLIIQDSTSSVFRNLIAFEQSCTNENYFVAYADFMGQLMSTPGDVTLLVKKGVVENCIGADNEVSDFFNNLVKRVVFHVDGEHFLSSTFEELKISYNSVGNKHMADLKQNHCRSPWLVIPVVAAAIVLVCSIVQTVFAILGALGLTIEGENF